MNRSCSWVLPCSFPSDLAWQSWRLSSVSSSHCGASLDFWFPPLLFLRFLTFAFATHFAWSLFSLHNFKTSQRQRVVLLRLLSRQWVSLQCRVHYIVLPKILLTPYSSFLLVIGPMDFCEGFGLASPIITFFQRATHPSAQLNWLSFSFQPGEKVFPAFSKSFLYMQKCMSAFCLQ